ncbi:MAG: molybdopterin molybdotransferase MoeA [Akkermansiaceae bacterium]|nr:molybdopterin molybdotransferase MoeA [Akkermansiaceae bacterium]MCP5545417.1 molybdopterin molybdotransferase MoeA [Akkermansiaceae bacterium]
MDALITSHEAESIVRNACSRLGAEAVPLTHAFERVLAEPLVADRPLPPYPRAMMDGIAFRMETYGGASLLRRAGLHAAGDPPPRPLQAGEGWEIMTGAAVPHDCDTVVPYEELDERDGGYVITEAPERGQCIHPIGLDAAAGDVLVPAGSRLGPAEIAIAASVGAAGLDVFKRARVAVLTTGDEAVPHDQMPEDWQIRRSNGLMLAAALTACGHAPVVMEHVADDGREAELVIDRLLASCDVLLLCGGISRGKRDHVRAWIEDRLGAPAFHGVKQRPGKPMAFWPGAPLVFALPGNPVSVLATFTRYVRPALVAIEGCPPVPARVPIEGVKHLPEFTWLLPVAIGGDGSYVARPPKNSGDFVSLAGSIAIAEIPPSTEAPSAPMFALYPFA